MSHDDRQPGPWTLEEYAHLVAVIRAGDADEQVARAVGRSLATVRQVAKRLLPALPEGKRRRSNVQALREALVDLAYPWEAHLRESYAGEGKTLWSAAMDAAVRQAWDAGRPGLPDLAREIGADEEAVARYVVEQGIASSTLALVDRLGATSGSPADMRARVARDDRGTAVLVVMVSNHAGDIRYVETVGGGHGEDEVRQRLEARFSGLRWAFARVPLGEGTTQVSEGVFASVEQDAPPVQEEPGWSSGEPSWSGDEWTWHPAR